MDMTLGSPVCTPRLEVTLSTAIWPLAAPQGGQNIESSPRVWANHTPPKARFILQRFLEGLQPAVGQNSPRSQLGDILNGNNAPTSLRT